MTEDNVIQLDTKVTGHERGASDNPTETETNLARQLDTVDLVVQGATLRQVADHFGVSYATARTDYLAGLKMVNERTAEAVAAMRDEVTMRQRLLIFDNLKAARAGDYKAAAIVQRADDMLAGLWGLRSARLDMTVEKKEGGLQEALQNYLAGVHDAASEAAAK